MATVSTNAVDDGEIATSKPPFLRRVRIRGYKSIAFCDVTLEPLTILVGRNASGKSNFLDALAFLRDAVSVGVAEAVRRRRGVRGIICRSPKSNAVELEVESSLISPRSGKEYSIRYEVAIRPSADFEFEVPREELTVAEVDGGVLSRFRAEMGRGTYFGSGEKNSGVIGNPFPGLFLTTGGTDPDWEFANALRHMTSYNFEPERMRPLHAASGETLLDHDGRNVANILSSIQADDQHSLSRIQRYFTSIAPAVELAEVKTDGDYATAQFRIRHSGRSELMTFDAWHMSDGTLRALGALVAVFQTARTFGPPSLVAIEEPEAALHPAAMRALMAAFDEATMRTQILLTTHSPDILDAVEVKPENVRVVQMIDGQTVIGTVDEASVSIVNEHLSSLGELERERQLEPNQDDLRRQADLARGDSAAS